MVTGTFPNRIEVEKDLFGPCWLGTDNGVGAFVAVVLSTVGLVFDFLVSTIDTDSCKSWAHG